MILGCRRDYSTLIPADRIGSAHFFPSVRIRSANSSGVLTTTSYPLEANGEITRLRRLAVRIVAFSRLIHG
jgi:hypothetical protein